MICENCGIDYDIMEVMDSAYPGYERKNFTDDYKIDDVSCFISKYS